MGKIKPKKPTLEQKKLIAAAGYNWKDLLILKETEEELRLVWRGSGKMLVINKEKVRLKQELQKYHEARLKEAKEKRRKKIGGSLSRMIGRT